jgi:hypothetical protein
VYTQDIIDLDYDPHDEKNYSKTDDLYERFAPDNLGTIVDVEYEDGWVDEITPPAEPA